MPVLTILLFIDAEKSLTLDPRWFNSMLELNGDAVERIQVIVLSQRESSWSIRKLAKNSPFDVTVIDCDQPRDSTGYPVWDIVAAVRQAWPLVRGDYVSFNHIEYIHGPGRISKTCDWLRENRPIVALGNLRRIATGTSNWQNQIKKRDANEPFNATFATLIDEYYFAFLQDHWGLFGAAPWLYWLTEPKVGDTNWYEDVFFANRKWFDALRFFEHGGSLPFQDIYDLMGPAIVKLDRYGLAPACHRLPRAIHDSCHIIHERMWGSYTSTMRQWFLDHESEYRGTTFMRQDLWDKALNEDGLAEESSGQVIDRFRRAPGGTVTRWLVDFSEFLQSGGDKIVQKFYEEHQREAVNAPD